jgi:hypothetical protein
MEEREAPRDGAPYFQFACFTQTGDGRRFLIGGILAGNPRPPRTWFMKATRFHIPLILLMCVAAAIAARGIFLQVNARPDPAEAGSQSSREHSGPLDGNYPGFRLRPFKVVRASATHQWTAEDCLTASAMRELAHNPVEEQRYREANQWTSRRQLVYRSEKTADFLPDLESGVRRQIVVPGFDGTEFTVDVQGVSRLSDGGFSLHGTVSGFSGSTFQLSCCVQGRETMTIQIPSEGVRYMITPREDHEVVLNELRPGVPVPDPMSRPEPVNSAP